VEEGAILMSAVQVQADGYLGAAKLLGVTVRSFVSSASRLRVTEPGANLAFGALYYGLGAEIARAEHAGLARAEIREMVAPVREIFARSPFVRRAQVWPRGYPGDFDTLRSKLTKKHLAVVAAAVGKFSLPWSSGSFTFGDERSARLDAHSRLDGPPRCVPWLAARAYSATLCFICAP
jgi:hypothetical protein